MVKTAFLVMLRKEIPQEFLSLTVEYLHNEGGLLYLHCNSIELLGNFVLVSALKNHGDSLPWPIYIPTGYVTTIADLSVPKAAPGFLSLSQ